MLVYDENQNFKVCRLKLTEAILQATIRANVVFFFVEIAEDISFSPLLRGDNVAGPGRRRF